MEAAEKFLGATYKAKETGSFGDYGCISFNGNNVFETENENLIVRNRQKWRRKSVILKKVFYKKYQRNCT